MEDEALLIKKLKSKDLAAFDILFAKYYKPIYYFIYKMIQNTEIAEDITQDTFVKVYKNLMRLDENLKFSPWIYKIAYNTFVDYKRKYKVNFELLDNVHYENSNQDMQNENNPEESILNKELRDKINRAFGKVNTRYRTALILRDYNKLSYKEVAEVLELSEAAVKSLIHRARLEFQKIFKELE